MENTLNLLLLSGDQLIRFVAFVVVFYFSFLLFRQRIAGSRFLLSGCAAVLIGEGSKMVSFTGISPGFLWIPGLLLTSLGFALAAFGFATYVRATIQRP